MAYELVENPDGIFIYGVCFADTIAFSKPLHLEGDLICQAVSAPSIHVTNGSLMVKLIECDDVRADILGVWMDDGYVKDSWRWNYLRPFWELPNESAWSSEASIENVVKLLEHPAIVKDPTVASMLLQKVRARPTCGRARVLFGVALEELVEKDALTELGVAVVWPMISDGLPKDWRW